MIIINGKAVTAFGIATLTTMLIPSNLYMYGSTDITYEKNVSSSLDYNNQLDNEKVGMDVSGNSSVNTNIAKLLGEYDNEAEYSLVFGEELAQYDIVYKSYKDEGILNKQFSDMSEIALADLDDSETVEGDTPADAKEEKLEIQDLEVEVITTKRGRASFADVDQSSSLLPIDEPDPEYHGTIVTLDPADRDLLEHLVMGEAGGEGMEGAALVAQAIRDTMVYKGFGSVAEVRQALSYSGSISKTPNSDVLNAVSYIFDQGGNAVQHKVYYFYAPGACRSSWHESQHFVIQHRGHRFFSN